MRWYTDPPPKLGDKRIKRKFLLIPRHFNSEGRWLEYAALVEKYEYYICDGYPMAIWEEIDFAD